MRASLVIAITAILLLVAAAAGGTLYLFGYFDTSTPAVDNFFGKIQKGRYYDAYRECAAILRTHSFESFETSVKTIGLDQLQSLTWTSKTGSSAGTEKTFRGSAKLSGGSDVPLTVKLVREAGGWRVFEIESDQKQLLFHEETASLNSSSKEMKPTDSQLNALILDTLIKFNEAVQIRYFGPFYESISTTWQRQTSPEELQSAFQAFIDNNVNFGGIARLQPVHDQKAEVTDEGLLVSVGHFSLPQYVLGYNVKFVYERGKWRLFAINLDLKAPHHDTTGADSSPAPAPALK